MESKRIEMLKKYILDEPSDPFLRYALALEFMQINQLNESEKIFRDILQKESSYLPAYYQFGKLLEAMQKKTDAVGIYTMGIDLAKQQANAQTLRELKSALEALEEENED